MGKEGKLAARWPFLLQRQQVSTCVRYTSRESLRPALSSTRKQRQARGTTHTMLKHPQRDGLLRAHHLTVASARVSHAHCTARFMELRGRQLTEAVCVKPLGRWPHQRHTPRVARLAVCPYGQDVALIGGPRIYLVGGLMCAVHAARQTTKQSLLHLRLTLDSWTPLPS
jgi:hypothetical protein